MSTLWIGTSGYNYPEWKGPFYPADLPAAKMLSFYSKQFSSVEINYSFYRLPSEAVLEVWRAQTPDAFSFSLKAPRRITHDARLRECADLVRLFCERATVLGAKLGVLLFQLAPSFKKQAPALREFLGILPPGARAAFEFRHQSWHDSDIFAMLQDRNAALCIADSPRLTTPLAVTADFGYLRLRDEGYSDEDLDRWARLIGGEQHRWRSTFVYFKHEAAGTGPEFARRLRERLIGV